MDFEIKNTQKYGKGLFSSKYFNKDEVILKFRGKSILRKNIQNFYNSELDPKINNYLQVGTELYLDVSGDNSYFINHSCDPNTIVKVVLNSAFLIAIKPIFPNEQITFDYSTTSTEDEKTWKMECACSKYNCRKLITGFASLNEKQQKYYVDLDGVPNYVKKYCGVI